MEWILKGSDIKIELLDNSYQVQKFLEMNNFYIKSRDVFSNFDNESKKIDQLVEDINDEFVYSKKGVEAMELCIKEAELKLSNYHPFLIDDIMFDNYSIKQFKEVYKLILARALLRRRFVSKHHKSDAFNTNSYTLILDRNEFIEALAEDINYDKEIIEDIISDITLDDFKISKHQGINKFPLIYNENEDNYIMIPNCVCFCDIFISLRKLWALRNPDKYGKVVAPIVGKELAKSVDLLLSSNGFPYVIRNYSLGKDVPDIDVLAIWDEKDFGKVVFICETKNPIPESFGKDYVRSVDPKGFLPKAKKQLDTIRDLFDPIKFRNYLIKRYPEGGFEYGVYALNFLIITSYNIGAFFSAGDYRIIDWENFRKIIQSAEGDVLHILRSLDKELLYESCLKASKVVWIEGKVGKYNLTVPAIGLNSLMEIKKGL